jgi:hypothetical protein
MFSEIKMHRILRKKSWIFIFVTMKGRTVINPHGLQLQVRQFYCEFCV